MKYKEIKSVVLMILLLVSSCGEPDTIVTNVIHPDGSVTRRIEMKGKDMKFNPEKIQVPFDSTWTIRDTIEIKNGEDTVNVRIAEKEFGNVAGINSLYLNDKGSNAGIIRNASFTKHFRWFFTTVRFTEKLNNIFLYGYPVERYLSEDELTFFYMPDNVRAEKLSGSDSASFKEIDRVISQKTDHWMYVSLASEWIEEFSKLTAGRAGEEISREALKAKEEEISKMIPEDSDSTIYISLLGENNYRLFRTEADSANSIIESRLETQFSFSEYSVKYVMPGKVIGTNGFIDKNGEIVWPVKTEYFFTVPFEMWAESKVSNLWAWIVSGAFLIFVIIGLIIRQRT